MSAIEAFFGGEIGLALWAMLGFGCAGAMKGALGFGLPICALTINALFLPVDLALALNSVVAPLSNIEQIRQAGGPGPATRRFWPMLVGIILGAAVGAFFVAAIDKDILLIVIGVFVLFFTTLMSRDARFAPPAGAERRIGFGVGVLAGGVGVISTINGPLFVLYLVSYNVERRLMVGALAICFLLGGALNALVFWSVGFLDGPRFALALLCLIPAVLAMRLGDRLAAGAAPVRFRRIVLGALAVLSLNLIWRGAQPWIS